VSNPGIQARLRSDQQFSGHPHRAQLRNGPRERLVNPLQLGSGRPRISGERDYLERLTQGLDR